ncbi:MAG: hypothetical protein V4619_07440 [Bacteroidota bacterium]
MKHLILSALLVSSLPCMAQSTSQMRINITPPRDTSHKTVSTTIKTSYKVSALKNNIVIENDNGFTSTYNRSGNLGTITHSDGSSSTIAIAGNAATVSNSNGTIYTVITTDNVSIINSTAGKVATVTNNGATSTIVNADNTSSTINNYGDIGAATYANGTAYAIFNYAEIIKPEVVPVNGVTITDKGITAGFTISGKPKPTVTRFSSSTTTTVPIK